MTTHQQSAVTLNDGTTMPQLGLGVWRTPAGDAAEIVGLAVEAGYRAVDTASAYNNEDGVGQALAGQDVFLTTKLWNADQGFDETLRAFEASAKRLKREAVDLYLIHWPAPKKGRFVETWKALVRLQEDGRAKSIGVSNFNEDHLEADYRRDGRDAGRQSDRVAPALSATGLARRRTSGSGSRPNPGARSARASCCAIRFSPKSPRNTVSRPPRSSSAGISIPV